MERNFVRRAARLAPSAPTAHQILMRFSKSARSTSRASGAVAFGRGTADDAACGRAGASGAALRVLRTHCDAAESGFIGRRRRLGRALYPNGRALRMKL